MSKAIIGAEVRIIGGSHKGTTARLVSYEYLPISIEYWDSEYILEPGIYKQYSGATVMLPNKKLTFIEKENLADPIFSLTSFNKEVSDLQDKFMTGLIPVTPLRERHFFEGDTVKEVNGTKRYIVEKVRHEVILFPGYYREDEPVLIAREVDTEELMGTNNLSNIVLVAAGKLRQSFSKPIPRCNKDEIKDKIRLGMFPVMHVKADNEIYSDDYRIVALTMVKYKDRAIVFPFSGQSDRYVLFDLSGHGISDDLIYSIQKDMMECRRDSRSKAA